MQTVDLKTARAKLGELVERASDGEVILLTKRGKTVAALIGADRVADAITFPEGPVSEPGETGPSKSDIPLTWKQRQAQQAARDRLLTVFKKQK